jgi:GAF domain-containing protein
MLMDTNTLSKRTTGCADIIKKLVAANIEGSVNRDEIMDKIRNLSEIYSLKEISDAFFEESIRLTGSKNCYVAFVDPENKDSVGISFSHLTEACQAYEDMGEARFKVRDDDTYGGLLGYSLDTGESFYIHDISSHPAAHGLPPGHEPVNQFLSVPVMFEGEILGQIVTASPEEDYGPDHVAIAKKIADVYGMVLNELL